MPTQGGDEVNIGLRVTITVSGNPPQNQPDSLSEPAKDNTLPTGSTTQLPSTSGTTTNAPQTNNDPQAAAETQVDSAVAGLAQINPKFSKVVNQLPDNALVSEALDVAKELSSVLSTIDVIAKIVEPLADVRLLIFLSLYRH